MVPPLVVPHPSAIEVLGPNSPLSRELASYEHRTSQLQMAEAVERALSTDSPLFVEAGTGTGKTLAYLVPAVLSGRKVVISTATKALQEQVFTKDIPLVQQVLGAHGVRFKAALMKGLPNYLCRRRFEELRVSGDRSHDRLLGRIERWAKETDAGDRAELHDVPEGAEIWRDIASSSDTRIGNGCAYFEECFVTQMRREAEEASIVVVNHHLFLADLALRTGRGEGYASAIPAYDAVIFDEAHQLEDIATDFFGIRASTARVESLVRDAERTLIAAGKLLDLKSGGKRAVFELVIEASREFFLALVSERGAVPGAADVRKALDPALFTRPVLDAYGALDTRIRALEAYAEEQGRDEAVLLIARRCADLRKDLAEIVAGARRAREKQEGSQADEHDPDAKVMWLDVRARSVTIGASPIALGPTLREKLFGRTHCVVCTSATLAAGGGFHFAKARLGAPHETAELIVPSPFDYPSRAALYIPRDLPVPNDPSFDEIATERILELLAMSGGGAFVLCTSNRSMHSLGAALRDRVTLPLFVQGDAPKSVLLERFRKLGNAVLVATMSFWEGVDVPGHALRLVIIDKIPFAVPTDPLIAARCAQIDREGGSSFAQYSIPSAAITLKQGFGRLLRTQDDVGVVALLDNRAVTKGYGRMLLATLPPARRISELNVLKGFWNDVVAPRLNA